MMNHLSKLGYVSRYLVDSGLEKRTHGKVDLINTIQLLLYLPNINRPTAKAWFACVL